MWGLLAPGGMVEGTVEVLVWEEPGHDVARVTLVQNCRKSGFIASVCRKKKLLSVCKGYVLQKAAAWCSS